MKILKTTFNSDTINKLMEGISFKRIHSRAKLVEFFFSQPTFPSVDKIDFFSNSSAEDSYFHACVQKKKRSSLCDLIGKKIGLTREKKKKSLYRCHYGPFWVPHDSGNIQFGSENLISS